MTSSLTFRGVTLSSSPAHERTYDVFLSFQGADTRHNFTSHLYAALERSEISTYLGDMPDSGAKVSGAAVSKSADPFASYASFAAIEQARTSVVILSENYASSSQCLGELQKILEYKETKGQIVIPVIYKVRNNNFEEAIARLKGRYGSDQIKRWKAALSEVTTLPDVLHLEKNGDEAKFIDEIIQKIANHIKAAKHVAKHPDAIESPLHVPDSPSSPAQVLDWSSSPSRVGKESPAQAPDSPRSPSSDDIQAPVQEVNLSSSNEIPVPAQEVNLSSLDEIQASVHEAKQKSPLHVPDSSSSPSPVGIPAPNLSSSPSGNRSPSRVGKEAHVDLEEGNLSEKLSSPSSSQREILEDGSKIHSRSGKNLRAVQESKPSSPPSGGNGDQGGNRSISRKQGSNSSNLNQGATLMFLIGSVIGIFQLDDQFEKHPANMWIALVALFMFCFLHAFMMAENDRAKKNYQRIFVNGSRVLSGLLVVVSLISMHLPDGFWWSLFAIWLAIIPLLWANRMKLM